MATHYQVHLIRYSDGGVSELHRVSKKQDLNLIRYSDGGVSELALL